MSNIYKEVFLAALTGMSALKDCSLADAFYYSKEAANMTVNDAEIMTKIREGELDKKVPIKEGDNGFPQTVELEVLIDLLRMARNELDKAKVALEEARAALK